MSVLIKGMELPKNCDVCPLADTIICGAQGCPLIEVPPHGRLIDADALSKIILFVCNNNAFNCTLIGGLVLDAIYARPTIIEAEEAP